MPITAGLITPETVIWTTAPEPIAAGNTPVEAFVLIVKFCPDIAKVTVWAGIALVPNPALV